jgi:N-acetylneuraminic acid mutarotase
MIWGIPRSKGGIVIHKQVRLMLCILFIFTLITACASPTAGVTPTVLPAQTVTPILPIITSIPPAPTETPILPTFTPIQSTQTQVVWLTPRGYHAAAYDIKADRVIVFGGEIDPSHMLADTWTYDVAANTWVKMSPAQSPPGEGPMAYDSASDRTIYYTGNNLPSDFGSANQTWAYDYNTDTWTDLHAIGTPSGLLGARMVYDTKPDRMILFGGLDLPLMKKYRNETWAYDFNTNTWNNMNPTTSPPGQNFFQMVYDATSDRVLAWIMPDVGDGNNMWAYDFETNTWTEMPVKEPAWRYYGAMVYVPTVKRDFVFGGVTPDTEKPFDDLWTYDAVTNTWEQLSFVSGPSARGWHTMTYSTKSDRIVLIGGGTDRYSFTNEVWIFDPNAKTWMQVGPK